MKKNIFLLILVLLLTGCSLSTAEKSARKLYVVHIHGDWCMTCGSVDPVVHELEGYFKSKKAVDYIVFDETNPKTVTESEKMAKELGLDDLFEYQRHTGEVLFVDQHDKSILGVFAGVGDKEKYINATEKLLAGESIESHDKKPEGYKLSKPPADIIKQAKVFVIDIHHDKCGTCSITAPVFEKVAEQYQENKDVCFFTFDLSTKQTIDETREMAKKVGIEDIYNTHKHTGEVLFVNAATKKIKNTIVAETNVVRYHEIIDKMLAQEISKK